MKVNLSHWSEQLENLNSDAFTEIALAAFRYQSENCEVYKSYLELLSVETDNVQNIDEIPYLPISFFKSKKVLSGSISPELIFESSGTTGQLPSKHFVHDPMLYEWSIFKGFERLFGDPSAWCILALLPSYLERKNSSLVYMSNLLIEKSHHPDSGFFLNEFEDLADKLQKLKSEKQPSLLLGVSFALLDFSEKHTIELPNVTIMETGGMKGRREEITREQLHEKLKNVFKVNSIYSEYGMTELLSQAYAVHEGSFQTPTWMKVSIRDLYDPFRQVEVGQTGGINIMDLSNIHSCCFIETEDLGKLHRDGKFEVLGRLDRAEIRGCNLMIT